MMVGKVFGVASVLSVVALVFASGLSGCSTDSVVSAPTDAKADRTPVTVDDAATNQCFSDAPLDASKLVYNSPTIKVGACATADVTDLVSYIKANSNASFADLQTYAKGKYSASCAGCIFGDVAAATWAPILTDATQAGVVVGVNGGGCIEIVSNKGNACGKAFHQWDRCIDSACTDCTTDAEYSDCTGAVQNTACAAASQALVDSCGSSINSYIAACRGTFGIDEWINRSCVVGSAFSDAGTDGGDAATDGGDGGDAAAN